MEASEVRANDVKARRLGTVFRDDVLPSKTGRVSREFRVTFGFLATAAAAALVFASIAVSLPALGSHVQVILLLVVGGILLASCAAPVIIFLRRGRPGGIEAELAKTLRANMATMSEASIRSRPSSENMEFRAPQNPSEIATALDIATRGVDAQDDAVRAHLRTISDATATLLSAHTQNFAEQLAGEQTKLTEALELYGHTITSRLNVSGVALAREFRDQGGDLHKRVEAVGDSVTAAIARQGEAAARAIESASEEAARRLAGAHGTLSERAQDISDRHVEKVTEQHRAWVAAVDERTEALNEKTGAVGAAISSRLEETSVSLDRVVESALTQIEARIAARLDQLETRLAAVDHDLNVRWDARREQIASEFASAASNAQTAVAEEVTRLAAHTAERAKLALVDGVHDPLQRWADYADSTAERIYAATDRASQAAIANQTAIANQLRDFETAIADRAEALGQKLVLQSQALRTALEGAETRVGEGGEHLVATIEVATRDLEGALAGRLNEVDGRLASWREAWDAALAAHARFVEERADREGDRFDALAERHRAALTDSLQGRGAALADVIATAGAALQNRLTDGEQDVVVRLTAAANDLSHNFLNQAAGLTEALSSSGGALRDQILARQEELVGAVQDGLARTDARLEANLRATAETIDGVAARMAIDLNERGQAIERTLANASITLLGIMSGGERDTRSTIERGVIEAVERLDAVRQALVGSIADATAHNAKTLTLALDDQRNALEGRVTEAAEILGRASSSLAESIARSASEADATLAARRAESSRVLAADANEAAQAFAAELSAHISRLHDLIESGAARLQREFATPLGQNITRISEEGAELSAATRALAESITNTSAIHRDRLQQSFASEADAFRSIVTSNAESFRGEFESIVSGADQVFLSRGMDVARELGTRVVELKTLLAEDGFALLKAFEARGEQASQQIESISQRSLGDFERKAAALISLLTRRGDDLLSSMTAGASESARTVAHASSELEEKTHRAETSLHEIERRVGGMLALVDKRNAELSSALRGFALGEATTDEVRLSASVDALGRAPNNDANPPERN